MEYNSIKTPAFILEKKVLSSNINKMNISFKKHWKKVVLGYSYKTNSLPWLLNFMKNNDFFAEVVSPDEYDLAKKIGHNDNNIILNGPLKSQTHIRNILENGGILNIDSMEEAKFIAELSKKNQELKVGVRINFDLEKYVPNETIMGCQPGRFGFNIENGNFNSVLKFLTKNQIKVIGLHAHFSTKTKSLKVFKQISKQLVNLITKYNLQLEYIDIGGGFFGDKVGAPNYNDYAQTITNELKLVVNPEEVTLIFEPGAALVASCFKYVCEIFDKKTHKDTNLILSNGSIMHLDPQMNERPFFYKIFSSKHEKKSTNNQVVTGFTCMEKDRFLHLDKGAQNLNIGDLIEIHNAGAYSLNFVPLFIQFLPNVYLLEDNKFKLVREKWNVEDYMQKNVINT